MAFKVRTLPAGLAMLKENCSNIFEMCIGSRQIFVNRYAQHEKLQSITLVPNFCTKYGARLT